MSAKVGLPEGTGASFFDVYFLGIALVIAGHSVYWTFGFAQGFWEFFTTTMIISLAYFCLCLCLAEMISILPFSGGAYGFSRVTTGPYLGFIVGFFDSVSNIIYVSLFVRTCVTFFQFCFYEGKVNVEYDPLWWAVIYVGCFCMHIGMQKHVFSFISVMGFICVCIPIIFILGTAHLQDFKTNVTDWEDLMQHVFFQDKTVGFVRLLPLSSIMYFGVDMVCLVTEDTKNAVRVVPRVIMAIMTTLFVLGIFLMVCVAAQLPGILYEPYIPLPMMFGFSRIFHTTLNYASIYVLPSQFIVIFALMYVYGRQICALARSTLVPSIFGWTNKANCPYMAMGLGNFLGYMSLIALKYGSSNFDSTLGKMYYAAQMGSITVYIISMMSFIVFRYKYSTLERHFYNYGGIASAVVGIAIFAFTWVGLGFYMTDQGFVIRVFAALFGGGTVYYFAYARQFQSFSPEEQSILFAVYIIKANTRHKTVYRHVEKKVRAVLNYMDPEHSYFSAGHHSGVASPRRSGTNSQTKSHRVASSTNNYRIHPDPKDNQAGMSVLEVVHETAERNSSLENELDEAAVLAVKTKSSKKEGDEPSVRFVGGTNSNKSGAGSNSVTGVEVGGGAAAAAAATATASIVEMKVLAEEEGVGHPLERFV